MGFHGNNIFLARDSSAGKAKTGPQGPDKPNASQNRVLSGMSNIPGFPLSPEGNYQTYEQMAKCPSLFLVKQIVTTPIRRNTWNWNKRSDFSEKNFEIVKGNLDPLRMDAVKDGLKALEFEAAFFEIVSKREKGNTLVKKLKVLARYPNSVILSDAGGNITGLENKGWAGKSPDGKDNPPKKTILKDNECFIYRNDPGPEYPYGQSRYENCREDWACSRHLSEKMAQYLNKIAGIIIQCHYPDGTGLDASGAARPNFWLAEDLLAQVGAGRSVAIPNKFASFLSGDKEGNVNPADWEKALASAGKSDWVLSAFDPGGTDYTSGFLAALAYYDKRMFRGWGRGERSGLEAESGGIGTSDAGTHTDTGMLDSELIDQDFASAFSTGVIDKVVVQNWGEKYRGAVWVTPAPLIDSTVDSATKLLLASLGSPVLAPIIGNLIDWNKVIEDASMPVTGAVQQAIQQAVSAAASAANNPVAMARIKELIVEMGRVSRNGHAA